MNGTEAANGNGFDWSILGFVVAVLAPMLGIAIVSFTTDILPNVLNTLVRQRGEMEPQLMVGCSLFVLTFAVGISLVIVAVGVAVGTIGDAAGGAIMGALAGGEVLFGLAAYATGHLPSARERQPPENH